jgi:outer membrane immunogenic protein
MTFKLVKAGAAAAALLATPLAAVAADMRPPPVYKGPLRPMIAYYNWTGFYLGGTVGYGTGTSQWDVGGVSVADISPKGMMYGVTLGYGMQAGSFVYGFEGDYSFSDVKGSVACAPAVTCETSNKWLATFRGRIGYAFDRFLPYLTAGGAYGNIEATVDSVLGSVSESESKLGYTVGAGLEYAFLSNWSAKLEYLYVDLGKFQTSTVTDVGFHEHVLRLGVNYKFGPVVSRW